MQECVMVPDAARAPGVAALMCSIPKDDGHLLAVPPTTASSGGDLLEAVLGDAAMGELMELVVPGTIMTAHLTDNDSTSDINAHDDFH